MTNVVSTSKAAQSANYSARMKNYPYLQDAYEHYRRQTNCIAFELTVYSPVQPIRQVGNGQRALRDITRQATYV